MGARTSAGRCNSSITLAIVKVLPEPVTPSSTCVCSPSRALAVSSAIAVGWSPDGSYSETSSKRLPPIDFSGRTGLWGTNLSEVSGSSSPRRITSSAMRADMGNERGPGKMVGGHDYGW